MRAALMGAELRRSMRLARSYWLEYLADLVLYCLGFLLLIGVFRAASPDFGPKDYLSTLIGYLTWKVCASTMIDLARVAEEEARTGTLEQLFLSNLPTGLVFTGRGLGIMLNQGIRGFILGGILAAIIGGLQPVPPSAFVLFILTLAGAFGLGIGLAGLVLVYKRVGGMLQLLWQMLVFFTGALAPLPSGVLGAISKLLPLTWGITCLREVIVNGATLSMLRQDGLLAGLLLNTFFYVILGIVLFTWGARRARLLGVLAHY